jgi:hypothetical protein
VLFRFGLAAKAAFDEFRMSLTSSISGEEELWFWHGVK